MNTTNKTKGLIIASIIAFVATIFTACVPTPGGGGTTPSGTFNVGISVDRRNMPANILFEQERTIVLDGDSISFKVSAKRVSSIAVWMEGGIWLKINNNADKYQLAKESFNFNKKIDNNSSIEYHNYNDLYNGFDGNYVFSIYTGLNIPNAPYFLEEGYWVIRKDKGNGNYLYCWVKMQYNLYLGIIPVTTGMGGYVADGVRFKVLNGKYQLNSITTGL